MKNIKTKWSNKSTKYRFGWLLCGITSIALGLFVFLHQTNLVVADYAPDEFVTTWKTDNPGNSNNNQITIPTTGGGYNYNVAWEEVGNPGNNGTAGPFAGNGTVTFPLPGTYEVRITGDFPRIYFFNTGDRQKILTVEQWGDNQWSSMENAFNDVPNLAINATDAPDLSNVTSTVNMFKSATSFNSNINHWDVSNVTEMTAMFQGATSFNQPLNNWDVSNVTEMTQMFMSAPSFNQPLDDWDMSSVFSIDSMFQGATSFNQPLNNWDVSNVIYLMSTFEDATSFNQPLNNWDVSNVTETMYTFYNASSFNQSLGSWDMSQVTNGSFMLWGAALSTANYDTTLIGWSTQALQNNVNFTAPPITYCHAASARSYIITTFNWTMLDGGEQCYDSDEFVTTWKTDNPGESNDNQITIPTTGTGYNYTVEWEEVGNPGNNGTAGPFNDGNVPHTITFPSAGIYEVRIAGDFPGICFGWGGGTCNGDNGGDREKILTIEQWGANHWTSLRGAFAGAVNLQIPAVDAPDLSGITSIAYMFYGASSFNSSINHWDVSTITNMDFLFSSATSFNQPLDNWDTSSVTLMNGAFRFTDSFNQPLGNWDVSSVRYMHHMFSSSIFNRDISDWDTSSVINMGGMFAWNEHFNQSIGSWDTSSVIVMNLMFYDATSFNQPLGNWDVSSVVDMSNMFSGASSFNGSIGPWQTGNVEDMSRMFYGATSFNQPLNTWQTGSVVDMGYMFANTTSFDQDLNNWNMVQVVNVEGMFYGATSFNGNIEDWSFPNVVSLRNMFYDATSFNQPLSDWGLSSVVDMSGMFRGATSFNQPLGSWNVSSVTDMSGMFYDATSFNQPLSDWGLSSVVDMSGMFRGATSFNQPLGSWNVSTVAYMGYMLHNTALSTENYDTTLIGWSSQDLQAGVQLDTSSQYCDSADERQYIIDTFGWEINDNGLCTLLPIVATGDTVSVYYDWVGVGLEIISDGNSQITDHGVEYGETTDYGHANSQGWGNVGESNIYLYDLECETNYHYRAYVTNSAGTAYGEDRTFMTAACPVPLEPFDTSLSSEVVGDNPIENGDEATYRLRILNNGPGSYDSMMILVNVPEEASYTESVSIDRPGYAIACMDYGPTSGMADATGTDPGLWAGYTGNTLMCSLQLNSGDPVLSNEDIVIDISLIATQGFVSESTVFHALLMGNEYETDYDAINAVLSASPADPIYSHAINNITETVYIAGDPSEDPDALITTWKTDNPGESNDNQIIIPTHPDETYNYTVDWEEVGNPDNNGTAGPFTGTATITFPSAGTYKVNITGDFPRIYFNDDGDREKILTVEQWGTNQWSSMGGAFSGAINLKIPATDAPDLSNVTDMNLMFAGATSFNSDISFWDTSSVTDMGGLFSGATSFNQPLGNWDVSGVTSMMTMFAGAESFNQPLNSWDVRNVQAMGAMFANTTSFNQPLDNWDVSGATSMYQMFSISAFDQSLASWDVSNVEDMFMMFGNLDAVIEEYMDGIPYEDWPQEYKDLYGLPASGLSTENYDATLIAWSALTLQDDVTFDAGTSTYCDATSQRQSIIDTFAWTINDSGENCEDEEEPTDPETPGGSTPPTRPTTPPSTVTPDEPPVVPGEGEQPGVVEERTPEDDDEAAVVRDEDGLESEPGGGSATPRRPGGEAVQARENFVARTLDGVASFFGVSPVAVAQAFPWLLIILLLILALVTAVKVIQQLFVIAKTRKLVARQALLNHEKKSLISLATHYLRTPLTILSSGIEMLPTESTARQAISKATAGLKVTVDKLIGQIETNKNLVNLAEPSKPLHRRTSLLQPAIFVPTLLTLGLVLGANILVAVATTFDPGWQHIGAQIVGVLIVGGLFYVAYDHHRQKKTLQAYEQQLLKHEEGLDVARNQFVKGMADTLVPAVVAVDTAVPAGLPEDTTKFLKEGLRQLEHTVGDFILIGQLEKQILKQRATSVAVRDTVSRAQQQLKQSDAQLSVNIPADTTVHQPQFLLHKVFGSLIDNAVAHNKPNTPAEVTSKQGKAITAIEVTDYGEGIPEDKLSLLFKPLSRVQTAEDFTHQGIGLSLYVSRLIMHYLGGDISAASKVGKGTTMQVKVPNQMEV